MEETSQFLIIVSPSNLVYILIKPISTSPESLVMIGEKIFLTILSGAPPYLHGTEKGLVCIDFQACISQPDKDPP